MPLRQYLSHSFNNNPITAIIHATFTRHCSATQQSSKPVPIPRNSSRPVCVVEPTLSDDDINSESILPLNCHIEEDIVTQGTVIIIDSGAKISVISDDFIDLDYEPSHFFSIKGISQVTKSVPVFTLPVILPTLQGDCHLAVDSRLPPRTVQAQSDLASHVSEALHSTEGASPVSLEDILDDQV